MKIRYYKHKLQNLIVVENIVTIHYMELKPDFDFRPESHDFWELVYADKDSVVAKTETEHILEEGEMIFHKPNEVHSLAANGKTAANVFILSFVCKSRAMGFFENRKFRLPKRLVHFIYRIAEEGKRTFDLPRFDPNLTKMQLLENPTLGGQQLIKNYLEILLVELMRTETEREGGHIFLREEEEEGLTTRAIAYMKENLDKKLTIAEICEAVHYNKSYLFRSFKKDTGRSVMEYFTHLKIERAKKYLRENKMNITQIAEILAFDTPNYFTKTFQKITGYSPLQYKKIYLS